MDRFMVQRYKKIGIEGVEGVEGVKGRRKSRELRAKRKDGRGSFLAQYLFYNKQQANSIIYLKEISGQPGSKDLALFIFNIPLYLKICFFSKSFPFF